MAKKIVRKALVKALYSQLNALDKIIVELHSLKNSVIERINVAESLRNIARSIIQSDETKI